MGKRIEDLPLDDTPFDATPLVDPGGGDVRATSWFQFIAEIDELLESEQYGWAEDTLLGIKETVEKTQRVTDGQQRAITNIQASRERPRRGQRFRWRR